MTKNTSNNQQPSLNSASPSQEQIKNLIHLYQSGQLIKVEQICSELLYTYPDALSVLNILGASLMAQEKYKKSLKIFNKIIQLNPFYASAYGNRCLVLSYLGLYKESLISCDKAIELNPNSAEAYCNRGVILKKLGNLKKSINDYNTAIRLKPNYSEAYYNRAEALMAIKQFDNALET